MFARIDAGRVVELFTPPTGRKISDCFAPSLVWADVTAANPQPQPGWSAAQVSGSWTFAAPAAVSSAPTRILATAFLNRITPQEQAAIASAAMSQPQMLLWLINMAAAGDIDLSDPDVHAGVNGLVPAVLTSDRAAAILTP